jgi:hypothetical protein
MKHIGWVKFCRTWTSWPCDISEAKFAEEPWPCNSYFSEECPKLDYDEPDWQFFFKKLYVENT